MQYHYPSSPNSEAPDGPSKPVNLEAVDPAGRAGQPDAASLLEALVERICDLSSSGSPADLESATRCLREVENIFIPQWPGTRGCIFNDTGLILDKAFGAKTLSLRFSADGKRLAGIDESGLLRISSLENRDMAGRTMDLSTCFTAFKPEAVALSANFKICALGNYARLCLLDITGGEPVLKVQDDVGFNSKFVSMSFSHLNDSMLAVCRHDVFGNGRIGDYSADVYEIAVRARKMSLDVSSNHGPRFGEALAQCRFSANDRDVIFTEDEALLSIQSRSGFLAGGTSRLMDLAAAPEAVLYTLSPTGNRLAQSIDRRNVEVCLFEDRKRAPVKAEIALPSEVRKLCFDHSGSLLACADSVDKIHLFAVEKQKDGSLLTCKLRELRTIGTAGELAFTQDGSMFACTNGDGALTLFKV